MLNFKECPKGLESRMRGVVPVSPIAYTSNDDYREAFIWERLRKYVDVL